MRCLNTSFPFFIALYALCFFKGPSRCYSQKTSDSISYYYKAILNPQSPADLPNGIRFYSRKKEQDLINEDTLSAIRDLRMISIGQFEIGNV
jgi:hypothetical protein